MQQQQQQQQQPSNSLMNVNNLQPPTNNNVSNTSNSSSSSHPMDVSHGGGDQHHQQQSPEGGKNIGGGGSVNNINLEGLTKEHFFKLVQELEKKDKLYEALQSNYEGLNGKLNQLQNVNKEFTSAQCKALCDHFDSRFGVESVGEDGAVTRTPFIEPAEREWLESLISDYTSPHSKKVSAFLEKIAMKISSDDIQSKKKSSSNQQQPNTTGGGGGNPSPNSSKSPNFSSPLTSSFTMKSGVGAGGMKRPFDQIENTQRQLLASRNTAYSSSSSSSSSGGGIPYSSEGSNQAIDYKSEAEKVLEYLQKLN
jgi:hypothetical protein